MTASFVSDQVDPDDYDAPVEQGWDRRRRLIGLDIEQVALDRMVEVGFEAATVQDLARAAGISVRTFFRYFPSKEEVLFAMPRRVADRLCAALMARPIGEPFMDSWRAVITPENALDPVDLRSARQMTRIAELSSHAIGRIGSDYVPLERFIQVTARRLATDPATDLRPTIFATAVRGAMSAAVWRWLTDPQPSDLHALMLEGLDLLESIGDGHRTGSSDQVDPDDYDAPVEQGWDRRRRLIGLDIEQVALDRMVEVGFEAATVQDLARAAGISVRTFFRYFPSKEEVLFAMPRRVADRLCAALMARPIGEPFMDSWRAVITPENALDPVDLRSARQMTRIAELSSHAVGRIRSDYSLERFIQVTARRLATDPATDLRPTIFATAVRGAMSAAVWRWLTDPQPSDLHALMLEGLDLLESIGGRQESGVLVPATPLLNR